MFNWLRCLFGKEETYSGGCHDAWFEFVRSTRKEMERSPYGEKIVNAGDLEAELIRELEKFSAYCKSMSSRVSKLVYAIKDERRENGNSKENSN